MYYPVLLLPNGTELKGGSPGSAVKNLTLHTAVNAGKEFAIGSAYSDYIEAEIWADPGGSLQITAGDALTYYRCSSPRPSGSWYSWPASGQGSRLPAVACPSTAATACRRSMRMI